LASVSQPQGVLIWRPGFQTWQRAEDVTEVATSVLNPPPLSGVARSTASSLPSLPERGDSDAVAVTPPKPPADQFNTGIAGWLALVAFGQVLGPIIFILSVLKDLSEVASYFDRLSLTFLGALVLSLAATIFFVYTSFLFFRRSKKFRTFFVLEILVSIFIGPITVLWLAASVSLVTGQPFEKLLHDGLGPDDIAKELGQLTVILISAAIWIPYMFKSKRVANTFTR
jgi:hypothetical protein